MWTLLLLGLFTGEIANDLSPAKPLRLSLEKTLVLGGEDKGDLQTFTATTRVAVDQGGRMFVLDPGNFRVGIFDAEGNHQLSFGKAGSGPGEFKEPVAIAIDPKSRTVIFDPGSKRMTVFTREGKYLKDARFKAGIQGVGHPVVFKNGKPAFVSIQTDDRKLLKYDLSLYDPEFQAAENIYLATIPRADLGRPDNDLFWVGFLLAQFEFALQGPPMIAAIDDKTAVAVRTHEYQGKLLNQKGKLLGSFSKRFKPRPFSESAKQSFCEAIWQELLANPGLTTMLTKPIFDKAVAKLEVPPRCPPIAGLAPLNGGFAILANYDASQRSGTLDVFDREGRHLGATPFSGHVTYFTGAGENIYSVGLDENDDVVVTRFAVKGW